MADAGAGAPKKKVKTWAVVDMQAPSTTGDRSQDSTDKVRTHLESLQHRPSLRTTDMETSTASLGVEARLRHDPANQSVVFKASHASNLRGDSGVGWIDSSASPVRHRGRRSSGAAAHLSPAATPPPPNNPRYAAAQRRSKSNKDVHERLYNQTVACRRARVELIDDYETTFDRRLRSRSYNSNTTSPQRRGFVAGGKRSGWNWENPYRESKRMTSSARTKSADGGNSVYSRLAQPKRKAEVSTARSVRPTDFAYELTGSTFGGAKFGKVSLRAPLTKRAQSPRRSQTASPSPRQVDAGRRLYDKWLDRRRQEQEAERERQQPTSAPHRSRSGSVPAAHERLYALSKEMEERRQERIRRKEEEDLAKQRAWLAEGQAVRLRTLYRPRQPRPHRPWHCPSYEDAMYDSSYRNTSFSAADSSMSGAQGGYAHAQHGRQGRTTQPPPPQGHRHVTQSPGSDEGIGVVRENSQTVLLDHMAAPRYEGDETYMLDGLTHSARERRRHASRSGGSYDSHDDPDVRYHADEGVRVAHGMVDPHAHSNGSIEAELPPSYDHATTHGHGRESGSAPRDYDHDPLGQSTESATMLPLPTEPPVLGSRASSGRGPNQPPVKHEARGHDAGDAYEDDDEGLEPEHLRDPAYTLNDLSVAEHEKSEERRRAEIERSRFAESFVVKSVAERANRWDQKHPGDTPDASEDGGAPAAPANSKQTSKSPSGASRKDSKDAAAAATRSPVDAGVAADVRNVSNLTWTTTTSSASAPRSQNVSFDSKAARRSASGSGSGAARNGPVVPPMLVRKNNLPDDDSGSDLADMY